MKKFTIFIFLIFLSLTVYPIEYLILKSDITGDLEGRVEVPYFFGSKSEPTTLLLNSYISKDVENFLSEWYDNSLNLPLLEEDIKPIIEAIIESQVGYLSSSFVSFYMDYFSFQTYQAHPMTVRKTYNYDLLRNKFVSIYDVLGDNANESRKIIIDTINSEIKSNSEFYFNTKIDTLDYYQDYYIFEDNLVIVFQLYEIAPYVSGIREFSFPLDKLGIQLSNEGVKY